MYKKENYWESHTTMGGKKTGYSEGSVADRGGNYESPGYSSLTMGNKSQAGYGFGKKRKATRLGGGYRKKSGDNPGHNKMSGGY